MFTFILDYKGQLQLHSETLTQNEKKERERRDGRNEEERKRGGREGQEMGKVGKIEESRSKVCVSQQPSPHLKFIFKPSKLSPKFSTSLAKHQPQGDMDMFCPLEIQKHFI